MKTPTINQVRDQGTGAFTMVELLVIAGIFAALFALAAPSLATTRVASKATRCLNNLRQLTVAWQMYAEDNSGRLVYNRDGGNAGKAKGDESWVAGWLTFTANNFDNTNTAMLVDHERYPYGAYLGTYARDPRVFKCPADPSTGKEGGVAVPRVRSVSMNNHVGESTRTWNTLSAFQLYKTLGSIARPRPADLFIFTDERADSINDGCFFVNPDTPYNLICFPGAYHNNSGSFSFADGHTETHRWGNRSTVPPLRLGIDLPLNATLTGNLDVTWIQDHASARQ